MSAVSCRILNVPSKTPLPGQSLADLHPDIAAQWHPTRNGDLKPTGVKAGSNKKVWWQCDQGHEWFVPPAGRLRGEQCRKCADRLSGIKRSTPKPGESLLELYPEIAADWHPTKNDPLTAADVNAGAKAKRWWKCRKCGLEWKTDPDHRTRSGQGCPDCAFGKISSTRSKPRPGESLAEKLPDLLRSGIRP